MKRIVAILLLLCSLSVGLTVAALEHVFLFNTADDFKNWKITSQPLAPLAAGKDYATVHAGTLRFKIPNWQMNMVARPSCQGKPVVADWSQHNRLIIDVVNPNPEPQRLSLFISDSNIPLPQGLAQTFTIEGYNITRCVITISGSGFPSIVDRTKISRVYLYTDKPAADMELFITSAFLLKRGEATPDLPESFRPTLDTFNKQAVAAAKAAADQKLQDFRSRYSNVPGLNDKIAAARSEFDKQIADLEKQFAAEKLSLNQSSLLRKILADMPQIKRLQSVLKFHHDSILAGFKNPDMLVGAASSMHKLHPQDMPFEVEVVKNIDMSLARNEWESVQIAVMPRTGNELKNVAVTVSPLKDRNGNTLESAATDVVGFVQTVKRPPYPVSYVGWWPDPILRDCPPVSIKPENLQTFWLRFHAGSKQAAGIYNGTLTVRADGIEPVTLDLRVKVRDFSVPRHTPLPTAITFGYNKKQCSVKEDYDTMKFKYSDFLADYLIDYDHLYRQEPPDFEIIERLHRQGRLTAFNLGNVFNDGINEKDFEPKMKATIERIRPAYEKAKELGLLEYAYIYGFDERTKDQFPFLERSAQALRKEFPGVLLMTTSYDDSYGAKSVVKTIDAWCPYTPNYQKNTEKIAIARTVGKYVWWYICCVPYPPFTNWFVESDAIESRILMGAQTAKFRPDGFLYYHTSIWNDNKGIDCSAGPFTGWNPVSWTTYHGDGSLFYCDSNGNPLPSIRLENYRDGQEDYAYCCILEEAVRRVKADPGLAKSRQKWLKKAEAAIAVPESLVTNMEVYSRSPRDLRAWRDNMADLITECDFSAELNPWKGIFGVRGWRK